MKKKFSRILALALSLVMIMSLLAACGEKETETSGADTLVVATADFSAKFSPFFATTAYDMYINDITQLALLSTDREGNVVLKGIEGETRPYNGKDYTYKGIADCDIVENADGTVDYNITMRDDI